MWELLRIRQIDRVEEDKKEKENEKCEIEVKEKSGEQNKKGIRRVENGLLLVVAAKIYGN